MANTAPVVSIGNRSLLYNKWQQIQPWVTYSDADGSAAVRYQFWDSGTAATSGYFWTPDTVWAPNTIIDVGASNLSNLWLRSGSTGGSETLWIRAFDGTDWSSWSTFTFTTIPNTTPVAVINDQSLHANKWGQVKNWLSYSDANGDAATKYQFWDSGTAANSAYFFTSSNSHWAANTTIEVSASDLANVWVKGGSATGSETLWVRAFDGHDWGAWDTFAITTTNSVPVANVNDHSLHVGQWAKIDSWISAVDGDNDTITKYQFWDSGTAATSAYFWTPTNSHWAANTTIEISAADRANVWIQGGSATGSETLWVRAFDGNEWGAWDTFTLTTTTNTAPVATINDQSMHVNQWAKPQNWLSATDAEGDTITRYQFWDGGGAAGSGYFWSGPTNTFWPAGTAIDVSAADLGNFWLRSGAATGSDTMYVRAFDGTAWGSWDSFTLTSTNATPIATINDQTLSAGQWAKVVNWTTSSDADGDTITKYQLWDGNSATTSAYFWTPDNFHWQAGTAIDVTASNLANVWVQGGTAGGSDTMYIRAFDGTGWSAWDNFTLTTLPNSAPIVSMANQTLHINEWSQINTALAYSDAEGHRATQYQFWDGNAGASSGYFWTPSNSHWAAGTAIDVGAGDLNDVWFRGGASTGADAMYVRAFDGIDWSSWHSFMLTTI
ncbi:hypothetical protein ACO2JO_14485 [Leptospira interrogans]